MNSPLLIIECRPGCCPVFPHPEPELSLFAHGYQPCFVLSLPLRLHVEAGGLPLPLNRWQLTDEMDRRKLSSENCAPHGCLLNRMICQMEIVFATLSLRLGTIGLNALAIRITGQSSWDPVSWKMSLRKRRDRFMNNLLDLFPSTWRTNFSCLFASTRAEVTTLI